MANRIKQQGRINALAVKNDNVGNYHDFNGHRTYRLTTPITTGVTSTTVNGHTAPEHSHATTSHATGAGKLFIASATVWVQVAPAP